MHAGHVMLADHVGYEKKVLLCHTSGSHAKTQHTGLSTLLGIASVKTGKALVCIFIYLSGIKSFCFFSEFRELLLPELWIDSVHGNSFLKYNDISKIILT